MAELDREKLRRDPRFSSELEAIERDEKRLAELNKKAAKLRRQKSEKLRRLRTHRLAQVGGAVASGLFGKKWEDIDPDIWAAYTDHYGETLRESYDLFAKQYRKPVEQVLTPEPAPKAKETKEEEYPFVRLAETMGGLMWKCPECGEANYEERRTTVGICGYCQQIVQIIKE